MTRKSCKFKPNKPIVKILAEQVGGKWKYNGQSWDCDDGRWAVRTCSCFPDDSDCKCFGHVYVYSDTDSVRLNF